MNAITWQLVKKDWHISRYPMLGYALLGALSLVLIYIANNASFYVGTTLLITVLVVVGIHMIFVSIIHEASKQRLPFIMSLPITFMQYTRAKMLANLGIFAIAWLLLATAVVTIILNGPELPNGLIPFALIVMGELFVANVLIFGVALVTESEAWTIVVMALCNLCISIFIFFVSSFPDINAHMSGEVVVWNRLALTFIVVEVLAIAVLLALIFYAQARKRDYL